MLTSLSFRVGWQTLSVVIPYPHSWLVWAWVFFWGAAARGQGFYLASEAEGIDQREAGYPDALIQCLQCGQMIRQADMVSHSTACRGSEIIILI